MFLFARMKTLLGNRILIEPITEAEGIIARPEKGKERPHDGRVLMVGSGDQSTPMARKHYELLQEISVGDLVRVDIARGGLDLKFNGLPARIVSSADVQLIYT